MRRKIGTALAAVTLASAGALAVLPAAPASAAPICTGSVIWGYGQMPGYNGSPRCATQQGNVSHAVYILQYGLNTCYRRTLEDAHVYPLDLDGSFGPKTRTALTAVQRQLRITADGVYGPQTGNAMRWPSIEVGCTDTPPF